MMLPPFAGLLSGRAKSPVPTWNLAVLMLPRRAALDSRYIAVLPDWNAVVAPALSWPGL